VIFRLLHRTTYTYESPVTFARCVLRLTPPSSATQTVLESSILVTPAPVSATGRTGPFGEQVLSVVVDQPHEALVIEARALVDVHAPPIGLPLSQPWDHIQARALRTASLSPDDPAAFLYPTGRTPLVPEITRYARASFPSGRALVEGLAELMSRIPADFIYDGDATEVSTPPQQAFEARRGVCQDFAHIMLCGLRGLGLPAAYVSGYLRTYPPPGRPRLEGADATHAWVSAWCGDERGWIGFDPTNALLVENDHIVLAVGRDYADIAPVEGIILAPGEQTLKVEVDVAPQDEAPSRSRAAS
jgi:transglutaminase-like putative cysteine protease